MARRGVYICSYLIGRSVHHPTPRQSFTPQWPLSLSLSLSRLLTGTKTKIKKRKKHKLLKQTKRRQLKCPLRVLASFTFNINSTFLQCHSSCCQYAACKPSAVRINAVQDRCSLPFFFLKKNSGGFSAGINPNTRQKHAGKWERQDPEHVALTYRGDRIFQLHLGGGGKKKIYK